MGWFKKCVAVTFTEKALLRKTAKRNGLSTPFYFPALAQLFKIY
jgi:hypothetical protein